MERFPSLLGNKEVMSIRVSKEIRMLLNELVTTKEGEGMSTAEIIEYALYTAFKAGLLCSSVERKKIADKLNTEIQKTIIKF